MSISYEHLYHLNLSTLDAAVEAWRSTVSKMKSIDRDYGNDVQKPFTSSGWKSSDSTSQRAAKSCEDIGAELTDAQHVAQEIQHSLSETRRKLKKHQDTLRDLADTEAPKQHLKVSPTGTVSFQEGHESDEDPQAQQMRVDAFADRISQVLKKASATDSDASRDLLRIIGSASTGFASPSGIGPASIQLASAGDGNVNIAPGPIPSLKPGNAPSPIREVTGILSYRPVIEGAKLVLKGKGREGLSYMWEGVPPYLVGKGASKAEKFSPGRHRKPSFSNKVGKVGARVLGLPVGIAATAFDYSLDVTGKEKLFDW